MSERLSRLGRVGAEEVTDAIGTCFTELLPSHTTRAVAC